MCSPGASYAIHIPILSSKYNPLRQVILALSAYHSPDDRHPNLATDMVESSIQSLGSDMYSRREESIATRHLVIITQLLQLPMREWRSILTTGFSSFDDLEIHDLLSGIRGAGSWLMLRFG